MPPLKSFRELNVYGLAREQAREIYEWSRHLPVEERYALSDQIRRSSRAVAAIIAEAWASSMYRAAFVNKLRQALGEAYETQAWLDHARSCGFIDQNQFVEFDAAWQRVGGMIR